MLAEDELPKVCSICDRRWPAKKKKCSCGEALPTLKAQRGGGGGAHEGLAEDDEDDDAAERRFRQQQMLEEDEGPHFQDDSDEPIKHPLIEEIFSGKKGSSYFKPSN